jgi:hypothetical protein
LLDPLRPKLTGKGWSFVFFVTTIINMEMEFDAAKNERNLKLRGISFELAVQFDFDGALEVEQLVDGEVRHFALGYICDRLHALVYTLRGDVLRIVSLRKANKREAMRYEQVCRS